ncbi:dTMP kinase [Saccharibacillus sp. CPCC 101409]|uniref:dTMP kinase n=1 Tax=Saccharibacillus sp. CPCC 101409 TaxID=3058041 RepID=UPI0026731320|nr:dTMP kinase [Saccharibacillus sp. CPCC 101409]MDO3412926.1 dTMP kinase [Saccharibacillus sp. CPCC 101409]
MEQSGTFIVLEGPDGSGKTTQIGKIEAYLRERGVDYISTREPGGVQVAEKIRSVILDVDNDMSGLTECLLYAAARREHLIRKVIPALEAGKVVICDRYIMSSLSYQGYGRELGGAVLDINKRAINVNGKEYWPDRNLYLDVTPEVGLQRIHAKHAQREINRLDLEEEDFHRRVREGYLNLTREYAGQFVTIDASQSEEHVFADIKEVIENLLFGGAEQDFS